MRLRLGIKSHCLAAGAVVFLLASTQLAAQEIGAAVDITTSAANAFCNRLRSAVRTHDASHVSKLVRSFPIEIDHGGAASVIEDNADFTAKFDLIFDPKVRAALFDPEGCRLVQSADGTSWLAKGEIAISQAGEEPEPRIDAISPPNDVRVLVSAPNKAYEKGAAEFFKKFQEALAADNRAAVAGMCSYPIGVDVDGKTQLMENRAELIRDYERIFTPGVKKAVAALHKPIHVGWRGFMTDRGEVWLDAIVWTHVYRVTRINGAQEEPRPQK